MNISKVEAQFEPKMSKFEEDKEEDLVSHHSKKNIGSKKRSNLKSPSNNGLSNQNYILEMLNNSK